jgi:hypothetical protein
VATQQRRNCAALKLPSNITLIFRCILNYNSNELCKTAQRGISHFVLLAQNHEISQIEEDEVGKICDMYGTEETVQCFGGVTERKRRF